MSFCVVVGGYGWWHEVVDGCGWILRWLLMVVGGFLFLWMILGSCGWFWRVVGGCRWLWMVVVGCIL